jgi:hypothetical protein
MIERSSGFVNPLATPRWLDITNIYLNLAERNAHSIFYTFMKDEFIPGVNVFEVSFNIDHTIPVEKKCPLGIDCWKAHVFNQVIQKNLQEIAAWLARIVCCV